MNFGCKKLILIQTDEASVSFGLALSYNRKAAHVSIGGGLD